MTFIASRNLRRAIRVHALLAVVLATSVCARAATRADLDKLSETFWTWRATEQPFTNDDIPRLERAPGFVVDWSPGAVARYKQEIAGFETRWRGLDLSAAPIPDQVDWRLLGSAIARVRWELEIVPGWRQNPFFYVDQSLGAVYAVLLPRPPIQEPRQEEILKRLEHLPQVLSAGRENLNDLRGPYVRTTLQTLARIEPRMNAFSAALLPIVAPARRARMAKAIEVATVALVSYRDWVKSRESGLPEKTAVGREGYLFFLKNVALVSYSPEEIRAIGRQEWERSVSFESLQQAADTGVAPLPLFPNVQAQVADSGVQEEAIRKYMTGHGILSVPADVRHYVNLPVPPYIEALSFLGVTDELTGPSRLTEDGVSYKGDPTRAKGFFGVVSAHDTRPLILHEGVPGHYFQMAWSWHHPDPIRRHYYDSESNEGIGYYAEEMMQVAGLFDSSPRTKEYIYRMMRLRALRVEVDVRLALGEFTLEQAAQYLETTVPMDAGTAKSEAAMFASTPGQAITYELGKYDILRLMSDARTRQADAFRLQKYHDFIWLNGNVPFALQRWELLGDASQVPPVAASFAGPGA